MKSLYLLAALLIVSNLNAQKVKVKDGEILVDKVHKYDITETKNEKDKTQLNQYVLSDLDGNVVLSMTDTTFTFERLPNELAPRDAYHAYILSAPTLDLEEIMPYNPIMSYAGRRIKDLDKVGFFKSGSMDSEIFYKFLEKQKPESLEALNAEMVQTNADRKDNYNLTVEKIGALMERKPGTISVTININKKNGYHIRDGNTIVGEYWVIDGESYKPGILVFNGNKEEIAAGTIYTEAETINGLPKYKYNLKLYAYGKNNLEENFKWFYENVKSSGTKDSISKKLEIMAKFLINEGFL